MKKITAISSGKGAVGWFLQRLSAVVLFVLLLFHFISYHFIGTGAYKWELVVKKMQSPWFNLMQFIFLLTALYHGINGLWIVSEDYIHGKIPRLVVLSLLILLGVSLFFVGVLTIFKISSMQLPTGL